MLDTVLSSDLREMQLVQAVSDEVNESELNGDGRDGLAPCLGNPKVRSRRSCQAWSD